jgi:predicted transposase YdaD
MNEQEKAENIVTANDIGKIFRGHNIIEFKSPEDSLNYDTYIKGIGYACIYKANEEHIDDIQMDDITLTFLRSKKPQKLIRKLIQEGYQILRPYPGIYYLQKSSFFFPIQIIVTAELESEEHVWLRALTDHIQEADARRLAEATRTLSQKGDIDNADAVINVTMKANREFFEKIKEDEIMCEALREFFRPELEEATEKGIKLGMQQGMQQGVQQTTQDVIERMLRKGKTPNEIHDLLDYPLVEIEEVLNQMLTATE